MVLTSCVISGVHYSHSTEKHKVDAESLSGWEGGLAPALDFNPGILVLAVNQSFTRRLFPAFRCQQKHSAGPIRAAAVCVAGIAGACPEFPLRASHFPACVQGND